MKIFQRWLNRKSQAAPASKHVPAAGKHPSAPQAPPEGTNTTQAQPDPRAQPMADGEHRFIPRSPHRSGND